MEPIDLKAVPSRWEAFSSGRAFAIPDMAASPIIPKELVRVFRSGSAVIAKLEADGQPLGVFSLDWFAKGREIDYEHIQLIEAICAYASLAIRNARLYEGLQNKARRLEHLVEIAAALNSSQSLGSVMDLICATFEDLFQATHCSVNLIDEQRPRWVRTLAVRGVPWFIERPEVLKAVSQKEIARVSRLWQKSAEPVVYANREEQDAVDPTLVPTSVRSAALFPLIDSDSLLGFVVTGFSEGGGPTQETLEFGQALADQAATAIEKAALLNSLKQRLPKLEVLYRLSDVVAGTTDITAALRRLNRFLRPEVGIRLQSISISSAEVREMVGAPAPTAEEMEAIRSWRSILAKSRTPLQPRETADRTILVPIVHLNRLQGALRVFADEEREPQPELLSAIAAGCAEIIYKAVLHKDLAETERRLVVSAERDRIGRDLHDSVGQILTGIALRLNEYIQEAPDYAWRGRLSELMKLAVKGSREVRESIHSLLFLDVRKRGLARSLRELAAKFEATTGIEVSVKVQGKPVSLLAVKEDALFRVVHESLMNVERHARATFVIVQLSYEAEEVSIKIRDDGVGLAHRDPFRAQPRHFGLRALRQLMEESGGSLEVENASPRGVIVEARVERGQPRKRRSPGATGSSTRR